MQGGDQSPGLDGPRCKEPGSGERNAQRGALTPGFGARGHSPLPVWGAAWLKHPNLRVTAIGGALTGSRAGGARRGPGSVRTERAARLGRRREESTRELRAVSGRTAGEGRRSTHGPFHRRPGGEFETWGWGQQRALVWSDDERDRQQDGWRLGGKGVQSAEPGARGFAKRKQQVQGRLVAEPGFLRV